MAFHKIESATADSLIHFSFEHCLGVRIHYDPHTMFTWDVSLIHWKCQLKNLLHSSIQWFHVTENWRPGGNNLGGNSQKYFRGSAHWRIKAGPATAHASEGPRFGAGKWKEPLRHRHYSSKLDLSPKIGGIKLLLYSVSGIHEQSAKKENYGNYKTEFLS